MGHHRHTPTTNSLSRIAALALALAAALTPAQPARAARGVGREELLFKRAVWYMREQKFELSTRSLEQLVKLRPRKGLYWFNLGQSCFAEAKYPCAIQAFKRVVALKSKLAPAAWYFVAASQRKLGQGEQALLILERLAAYPLPPNLAQQVRLDLSDLRIEARDRDLQRALEFYRTGRYEPALQEADRSLAVEPSGEGELLRGMILLRLRRTTEAREWLARAAGPQRPPAVQEDARAFLRQIREGLWDQERLVSGFVDFSAGYHSNPLATASSGEPQGRAIAELDAGISVAPRFRMPRGMTLRFDYLPSWEETVGLPGIRVISQGFRARFTYEWDRWLVQATPSLQHELLGSQGYQLRPGFSLRGERALSSRQSAGLIYDFARGIPLNDEFSYLGGNTELVRGYWTNWTRVADLNLALLYSREAIGDLDLGSGSLLPLANHGWGLAAAAGFYLNARTELSASASVLAKSYDRAAEPGAKHRSDTVWQLAARLSHRLSPAVQVFASPRILLNSSSLGPDDVVDKNYKQLVLNLGLTWDLQ